MTRFRTIAVVILLWNLIGDAAYLAQVTADPGRMAQTDPDTAEAFAAMPAWAWSADAIAVWGGTAAAIALLARRRIAVPLFALSLAAIVVQFSWSFLVFGVVARQGPATIVFPLFIAVMGIAQLIYARDRAADRTLK
jgi:hypothetical protein